jgi:hypothetical protein
MQLDVDSLSHDGTGVARVRGKVVFVPGALPGETVVAELRQRRSGSTHIACCGSWCLRPSGCSRCARWWAFGAAHPLLHLRVKEPLERQDEDALTAFAAEQSAYLSLRAGELPTVYRHRPVADDPDYRLLDAFSGVGNFSLPPATTLRACAWWTCSRRRATSRPWRCS